MSASCYKIVPNRHVFLDFMVTLDLSPEQRHCVETFPIRYVEVDEPGIPGRSPTMRQRRLWNSRNWQRWRKSWPLPVLLPR